MPLGRWLFAGFLVGHGFVRVMFAVPRPTSAAATNGVEYPFDLSRSWLVSSGIDTGTLRSLAIVLIVALVLGYVLAALATIGFLVPTSWWAGLVLGSTAISIAVLILAASPGFAIGYAIDAVLVWLVLASVWSPASPVLGS